MTHTEFKAFSDMLADVADYYGKSLTAAGIQIYWNVLSTFDLDVVRALLNEHVKASKFMPSVSELLDRLREKDGRPGPEEAWSMIPVAEDASVVWTDEMAEAFAIANDLIKAGELIPARMAFLERYRVLIRTAREGGKPVRWSPSLGHDPDGRERVLIEAQRAGRLSREHVAGLLPPRAEATPELLSLLPDLTVQGKQQRSLKEALDVARSKKDVAA